MYHIIHGIQLQAPNLVDRSALHNVKHTYFLSVADEAKTKIVDTPTTLFQIDSTLNISDVQSIN